MTDDSKLRALKVFLRAYAILSLILFGGLMIGLDTNLQQAGPSLRPLARASLRMTCVAFVKER